MCHLDLELNDAKFELQADWTFFDSVIRIKSFNSELKAHFFSNLFSFQLQEHFYKLNSQRWGSKLNTFEKNSAFSSKKNDLFQKRITAFCGNGKG